MRRPTARDEPCPIPESDRWRMADADRPNQQIVDWLKERGQTDAEIELVLERLRRYDQLTTVDAIMNAIELGEIDIAQIVQNARDAKE